MLVVAKNMEFRKQEMKESKKGNKYMTTTWMGDDEKTIDIMVDMKSTPALEKGKKYDVVLDYNTYYKNIKIVDLQQSK